MRRRSHTSTRPPAGLLGFTFADSTFLAVGTANGLELFTSFPDFAGGTNILALPPATIPTALPSTNVNLYCTASGQDLGLNANGITFSAFSSNVSIQNTALASISSASGAAGNNMSLTAQNGQAATGAGNNGGAGGALELITGIGGTSGSATAGAPGVLYLQCGIHAVLTCDFDPIASTITLLAGDGSHPINLTGAAGTLSIASAVGAGAGGSASALNINSGTGGASSAGAGGTGGICDVGAGPGGNATAGSGNGGTGGVLNLYSGAGGTSSGGTAGVPGSVICRAGFNQNIIWEGQGFTNTVASGTASLQLFGAPDFGGGEGVLTLYNAVTAPTSAPGSSTALYSDGTTNLCFMVCCPTSEFMLEALAPFWLGTKNSQLGLIQKFGEFKRTSNNTATTIISVALPTTDTSVLITVDGIGRQDVTASNLSEYTSLKILGINNNGTVTATTTVVAQNTSGWATQAITVTVSTTNILIQVNGTTTTNVDWTVEATAIFN
jgi:hypothetical protein